MSFRSYILRIEERVNLVTVSEPISTNYEMAGVLKELESVPVLFENVREANLRVVGNLFMLVVYVLRINHLEPSCEFLPQSLGWPMSSHHQRPCHSR